MADWTRRFDRANVERIKAVDLYCGNSWVPVRKLYGSGSPGQNARIWIVSAGQGLLSAGTEICPYSATFSPGQPDSVIPAQFSNNGVDAWWDGLIAWRRKLRQRVSSISEIAKLHPTEPLILALSSHYLAAVQNDILDARNALEDQEALIVISSGSAKKGPLEESFLPCDSRFENKLGRGRTALNVRLLAAVLRKHTMEELRISHLRPRYEAMLKKLPDSSYPKRDASTDREVRKFIEMELRQDAKATHSRLLKVYRDNGRACEQSRFRGLFLELKASLERTGG